MNKKIKISVIVLVYLFGWCNLDAQISNILTVENWAKISRYEQENKDIISNKMTIKAVFIGNSITEGWANLDPFFFNSNNYIGRGIGGQTTAQFLSRFRQDVINLNPLVVVINGGINDIAQNAGAYNENYTLDYIKSMAELADANGIKVILTSVLPAANIPWDNKIANVPQKISDLNSKIKSYTEEKGFTYVDYYSKMVDPEKAMIPEYTYDGVHVTKAGYLIMEAIIKDAIDEITGQ